MDGIRGKGRPKISWEAMVKKESNKFGLNREEDKKKWREGVSSWPLNPSLEGKCSH